MTRIHLFRGLLRQDMHHSYDFGRNFLDNKSHKNLLRKNFQQGGVGDPLNRGGTQTGGGGKSNQGGVKSRSQL